MKHIANRQMSGRSKDLIFMSRINFQRSRERGLPKRSGCPLRLPRATVPQSRELSFFQCGDLNIAKRPEIRKAISEAHKRRHALGLNKLTAPGSTYFMNNVGRSPSKSHRRKLSAALKGRSYLELYGPEEAVRLKTVRTKNVVERVCSFPNKFETEALRFINRLFDIRFSYCGDGSVFIGGKSPDAIHRKSKTVCLFNGIYFHLAKFGMEVNRRNKRRREILESLPFLRQGYMVVFVWEDELKKLTQLRGMVKRG
jgi:hypothetical protein